MMCMLLLSLSPWQRLEEELASSQSQLSEREERVKELEGVVEDKQEAVRIVEKKSQSLVSRHVL